MDSKKMRKCVEAGKYQNEIRMILQKKGQCEVLKLEGSRHLDMGHEKRQNSRWIFSLCPKKTKGAHAPLALATWHPQFRRPWKMLGCALLDSEKISLQSASQARVSISETRLRWSIHSHQCQYFRQIHLEKMTVLL